MKTPTLLILTGLLALTSGCHTPQHSNVLIFATNTKVAFDISYDPKIQQPNITLGFTRQEGVWMPLLANYGPDGLTPGPLTVTNTTACGNTDVTQIAPQMLYQGKDEKRNRDTYSVLATFAGKGAAKGSGTNGSEMSGSIAQFFATGLAARELAKQGGAALVSTTASPPDNGQAVAKLMDAINNKDNGPLRAEFDLLLVKPLDTAKVKNPDGTPFQGTTSDYANYLAGQIQPGSTWAGMRAYGGENLQKLNQKLQQAE